MATQVIYVSKPDVTSASGQGTPATSGLSFDDTDASAFASTGQLLALLERADTRGYAYSASSDGGSTFTQSSDKGGI